MTDSSHPIASTAAAEQPRDSPAYVIAGADPFLRREKLAELCRRLEAGAGGDGGASEHAGDEAELAAVLDDVRTPSLFASRRVTVVRDADGFISEHRAALERYLDAPSPFGVLILECRSCPATTRLYKRVKELGGMFLCEPPSPRALPAWLTQRAAARYGRAIDAAAARRLVDLVGDDLGRLDMELSKLAAYVGSRAAIDETDVEELVGASRVELVFGVTDAIARRDGAEALRLWDRVVSSDRDAPFRAVGGLAWGIRRLAEAARLAERGGVAEAIRQMKLRIPPGLLEQQLRQSSVAQWEGMLQRLLRLDVSSKSGGCELPVGVERFIVGCCGGTGWKPVPQN
jgi:DNA polymerase-3 subunit delta